MIRRVLMTADAVTGVWPYALELIGALAEHDIEVLLAVMGPTPSVVRRRAAEQLPNLKLEHKPWALEWMDAPWADVRLAGDWLLDLQATWMPDVLHLNSYALAARGAVAPRLVVAHACACSWHEAVRGSPAPAKWVTYRRRVKEGLAAADVVVAPTGSMLKALAQHHGMPLSTRVIANACSPEPFSPRASKDPIIFAMGRVWDEARNLLMLDHAAGEVDWPLMIAGSFDAPGRAAGTFRHAGLLGELTAEAAREWYGRAAIFAHPAKYEPFGHSVLEAALSGCALVLSDIPSLRETWASAALFAEPNEPASWSAALRQVSDDAALRSDLSRRALERARCFSPRAQATAYVTSYEALVERTFRPARAS